MVHVTCLARALVYSKGSINISCDDDSVDATWEFDAVTKGTVMSLFNFIKTQVTHKVPWKMSFLEASNKALKGDWYDPGPISYRTLETF